MVGTAVAMLIAAGAAYAAFNTYTATSIFTPGKAGSKKKPSAFKMEEIWNANGTNGQYAAPLKHIVSRIYGATTDGKDFPKCTDGMITANHAKWDKSCPKGSLIAEGPVNAQLNGDNSPKGPSTPCNPYLHVYNGGQGKQVFFFVVGTFSPNPAKYECGGLLTGASAPYDATVTRQGNVLVTDIPLPPDVSTQAGGLNHVYASLVHLDVTYKKLTRKVHGKVRAYEASTACSHGKRPYSFTFTAQNWSGQSPPTETDVVSHLASC
jgi:hypothetical protein